jgi:ferrous iron transport protein B
MTCHSIKPANKRIVENSRVLPLARNLTFALAGNANVGKSVVFNHLTGSSQIIGNWPGKTVEKAQGILTFEGQKIVVVDLPGIYSFSNFSMEEIVSREYIALEHPDVVINVVDAAVLERNLFFTIQLLEMEVPLVVCLNQVDVAKQKGITIDVRKLGQALGVPVVSTVAIRGEGIYELTKTAAKVAENKSQNEKPCLKYGLEVEDRIGKLAQTIKSENLALGYSSRWVAIKLLENDPEIKKSIGSRSEKIVLESEILAGEISHIHDEHCFAVIASERYALANHIAAAVQKQTVTKTSFLERLDWVTTQSFRLCYFYGSDSWIASLDFCYWRASFFFTLKCTQFSSARQSDV